MAEREENYVTALAAQVAPAPVARVPLLDGDVHDLDGVQTVADHLFGLSGVEPPLCQPRSTSLYGEGQPTPIVISPWGPSR